MKRNNGFSLVELIVAVAIIGILAALVIPMYKRNSFKARQSEAKVNLSGIYTAEKSFYAEYSAYHPSFVAIGYSPEGSLRYNIGFGNTDSIWTVKAGPANGYNPNLSAAELALTSTLDYCSYLGDAVTPASLGAPGNNCRLLSSSVDIVSGTTIPSALSNSFTTFNNGFTAGALINIDVDMALLESLQDTEIVTNLVPIIGPIASGFSLLASLMLENAHSANTVVPATKAVYTDIVAMSSNGTVEYSKCFAMEATTPMPKFIWDGTRWTTQMVPTRISTSGGTTPVDASGNAVSISTTYGATGVVTTTTSAPVVGAKLSCVANMF